MRASPSISAKSKWQAYIRDSRRPLMALLMICPFLFAYHLAVLGEIGDATANGVDLWLAQLFSSLGVTTRLIVPIFTVGLFLIWHLARGDRWRASPRILAGMACESTIYAFGIFVFASFLFQTQSSDTSLTVSNWAGWRLIACCGAGIYEELVFRMLLLPTTAICLIRVGMSSKHSWFTSWIGTSILFASLHYSFLNPYGDPFELSTFAFRAGAGFVFGGLFIKRGIGIATTAHIGYDLLIVTLGS